MEKVRRNAKKHQEHRRKNTVLNTSMLHRRISATFINPRRAEITVQKVTSDHKD